MTLQSKRKTIGLRRFILTPMLLILASVSAAAQTNTFPTTGNAGAGTTSPDRKLEVLDSGSPQMRLTHTDGSVYTDFQTLSSGNLVISPTGPDTTSTKPFTIAAGSDAFRFYPNADTNLRWSLSTDASGFFHVVQKGDGWANQGTRLSINRSGNVGIGTTTPAYPLTINQTGNSINRILSLANDSSGSSAQAAVSFFEGATEKFKFGINSSGATGYSGGANAFQLWHFQNAPIVFGTNSIERMRISGAGNIGIGTTSPTNAKLHIFSGASGASEYTAGGFPELTLESGQNTDLYFLSPNTGSARIWFGSPSSNVAGGIMYFHNATPANGYMYFVAGNNSEKMRILGNGNIGIGTTAPASKLEVTGTIHSTTGGFKFPDGSLQTTAASGGGGGVTSVFGRTGAVVAATNDYTWAQINKSAANAGDLAAGTLLATRMPALTGDVTTSVGTVATTLSNTGVTAGSYTNANITVNAKGRITAASNGSGGSTAFSDITAGTTAVALVVGNGGSLGVSGTGTINATSLTNAANITSGTVPIARLGTGTPDSTKFLRGDNTWTAITSSQWTTSGSNINYATAGNVGIATANPTEKLHVTGNGKITGNLTVDGTINAKYQDLAEWVPSSEQLVAGTVVVLDTTKSNQVISSGTAYDTRVAGVISAQPGITLGEGGEGKVLVATTGRVRVKVDASRGPIQIGDLLVTSDVSGVAMKSEAVNLGGVQIHRPGTIIGKALEPLAKGSGEILVLLSLQ